MPPKPKFTKAEVAKTALDIIKEDGLSALTARSLASRLGTSSRPIFTAFKNMDEVKLEARELAMREFEQYAGDFENYTPAFKRIGMLMVSYAINEPELYKLLFMLEHTESKTFDDTIAQLGKMSEISISIIQRDYDMTFEQAKLLFEQVWIHTFGIGTLCAMNVCDFTENEIAEKLSQVFASLVMYIKSGSNVSHFGPPEKKSENHS